MKKVFVLEPRANKDDRRAVANSDKTLIPDPESQGRRGKADEENELGECALAFIRGSSVRR
jgi:hypothetical protein